RRVASNDPVVFGISRMFVFQNCRWIFGSGTSARHGVLIVCTRWSLLKDRNDSLAKVLSAGGIISQTPQLRAAVKSTPARTSSEFVAEGRPAHRSSSV